ncbi:MAG: YkvA family protein [Acidothermaceae bacterium]
MPWWATLLVSIVGALLLVWLVFVVVLMRSGRGRAVLPEAARVLPDVVRLVTRLARDRSLPRGVRIRLWLLLAYLASPIDIIPDFVPVVGYADDALVVALTLRSVVRRAGAEPVERHWPGTATGLTIVRRLAGLT